MNELEDQVAGLERSSEVQGEELDAHRRKILDVHNKNSELRYQVEDLEIRARRANIRTKGVLLQAAGVNLEDIHPLGNPKTF
ncbi:hypothetical protein NDU88_002969 [Pleurodeles waltl]|uniref:Uncharacterized protein n=1 Tax=Pleurodeles waltl TaxID=8319 RepID=A0AAV7TM56_PLEWA|nr:hypothetical protein NDU88_002969 [Pleurodeles waltl]